MDGFIYRGNQTKEISFPLGGIGTGCVGLAGNDALIDWEIFNRPSKGSTNGYSHMAVRVEQQGRVLDARVLQSDLLPPYSGWPRHAGSTQFGFGVDRSTLAGLPHFKTADFFGGYPFAELRFFDDSFPGCVCMKAFNPFIPHNDGDASLPAAFFEVTLQNTLDAPADYTVIFALSNPAPHHLAENRVEMKDNYAMLRMLRPAAAHL